MRLEFSPLEQLSISIRVAIAILHQKSPQTSFSYLIPISFQGPLISLVVSDCIFFQSFHFSYFLVLLRQSKCLFLLVVAVFPLFP